MTDEKPAEEKTWHSWVTDILERESKPAEPVQLPTNCYKCHSDNIRIGGGRLKCLACGDIHTLPGYNELDRGLVLAQELTDETKEYQRLFMKNLGRGHK